MSDLLPCPFCGGTPAWSRLGPLTFVVLCRDCHTETARYVAEALARAAWNQRPTRAAIRAEVLREVAEEASGLHFEGWYEVGVWLRARAEREEAGRGSPGTALGGEG